MPQDPKTVEDRRALRTKRLLGEAFTQLLEERGLDGFSVSDLAERADINRATFYAHYHDMSDLLLSFEEEIITGLFSLKNKIQSVSLGELLAFEQTGIPPQVTVDLFDQLRVHGSLLKVLLSSKGDPVFHALLRDQLCSDLVRSVLYQKYTQNPAPLTEYYISYYASALLGLIQRWLHLGMPEDSQHMARILFSIMMLKPGDPIELKEQRN
ncbi:MAG: TetR/AcrR family transcriptional regulator [Coriobacteriia bacterium]|jgi:AcrR family transcriptional regulator|nr:TetR/AcrR family transcriptional regulator [Coriobacteriia bacterium]